MIEIGEGQKARTTTKKKLERRDVGKQLSRSALSMSGGSTPIKDYQHVLTRENGGGGGGRGGRAGMAVHVVSSEFHKGGGRMMCSRPAAATRGDPGSVKPRVKGTAQRQSACLENSTPSAGVSAHSEEK